MSAPTAFIQTEDQIETSKLLKQLGYISREHSQARFYLEQHATMSNESRIEHWEKVASDLHTSILAIEDRLMQIVPTGPRPYQTTYL
jgi:hypothetical protein